MRKAFIFIAAAVAGFWIVKHCGKRGPTDANDYQASNIESAGPPAQPIQRATAGDVAGDATIRNEPAALAKTTTPVQPAAFVDGAGELPVS